MTFWAQLRIGPRLATSYAVVLLFLAAVVIVAVYRLDHLAQTTHEVVEGDAARAALANSINLHAESAAGRLLLLFILQEREQRTAVYADIDLHSKALDEDLQRIAGLLAQPAEQAALERIVALRETYRERFFETVDGIESGDRAGAERLMTGATRTALNDLLAETARLDREQRDSMTARQKEASATTLKSRYLVISLGVAALAAGLLLAVLLTRGIAGPLGTAVDAADRIAGGNLESSVPPGGGDEVGQLLARMGNMRLRLREVIGSIRCGATQVSSAAERLGQPAADVRNGSQMQREMAGQIELSVGQLTAGIGQVVDNAQATRAHAEAARDLARRSATLIVDAAREIRGIAAQVSESANSVENLRERADQVAGTVHIIKEIADQTNLLALNASIEAARAGESGRGFAVVADEVRKLSLRTAEATTQINAVIASIDTQTRVAVDSIHAGRTGMDRGMTLIEGIVAPLDDLCAGAQASLDNLESLSGAAQGQLQESTAIADNVHRIVGMAESNRHATEALATITGELAQQAVQLQQSVDAFRL